MTRSRAAAALRILLPISVLAAHARAQDVTVSPIAFVYPEGAPDQLPEARRPLHPRFPSVLLKTPDIGYATEEVFVDEKGKVLTVTLLATADPYADALFPQEGSGPGASWSFRPAARAGKSVNALIHFTVAFNPASAGVGGPEATPRLLDARPVVDPGWKYGKGETEPNRRVLWATVTIDEQGRPSAVKGIPEPAAALLTKNIATWSFSAARRAGRPVAQDVRVPFIVIPFDVTLGKDRTPPRVVSQVAPEYPLSMRQTHMRGQVVVQFTVDIEGRVTKPFVLQSMNPAFDAPALEAVSRWRFEPGRVDGVPVYTELAVPIIFSLDFMSGGGRDAVEVRDHGDASRLPEELRVDTQPRLTGLVIPVYPFALLRDGVGGRSEVGYIVDPQGRVATSRVIKADRPEIGLALQAAVERFHYEPAIKNGQPSRALLGFDQEFSTSDDTLVSSDDDRLLRLELKHPERIARSSELDSPVKALITRAPVYPRSLAGSGRQGRAVVEFLVDEKGHPRLPRIASATEPAFGYAAVQAAALWQFTPPTGKGRAVVTRVQVPFVFEPDSPVPSASPAR